MVLPDRYGHNNHLSIRCRLVVGAVARLPGKMKTSTLIIFSTALALAAAIGSPASADNQHSTQPMACEALPNSDFSGIPDAPTQILTAKDLAKDDGTPAQCLIEGNVAPQVAFVLHLPTHWNGKFLQVGCHGYCGRAASDECVDPLRRGYACISTNMGHTDDGAPGSWAFNNLQAKIDWGYRANHVVALAGKAISQQYYGRAPARSYFVGNSDGGREAMVEAQRFPWDFDGIIAGAAPINWTATMMDMAWRVVIAHGKDGKSLLSAADLLTIHNAVLAQCDRDDGLVDGIVSDPRTCKFDPSTLLCKSSSNDGCLSETQVAVVRKFYSGPLNSKGEQIYRNGAMLPGSELAWEFWIGSIGTQFAEQTFQYVGLFPEPGSHWAVQDFDFDRDYKRLGTMEALYSGSSPDLRQFKAAGGKLIVYQGWYDVPVSPLNMVEYYETAEKIIGGRAATQNFFRLFMIPGFGHGESEGGIDTVDYLSYLESWVERGQSPDVMIGARVKEPVTDFTRWKEELFDPSKTLFTRPLYPYPLQARYKGRGDPNKADNFRPLMVPPQ
jgi:Tannase and feruloyl esterase